MMPIERMRLEMESRNLSKKTIKAYLFYVEGFLMSVKKDPYLVTVEDVKIYTSQLLTTRDPRTVSLAISSITFLFRHVLDKELNITYPKRPRRLPAMLTKEEVLSILNALINPKHRLIIETIYGCGLRVSETARLKKQDIRTDEDVLFVRQSKFRKDRIVTLPKGLGIRLKSYMIARNDDNPYVFDSQRGGHVTTKTI